MKYLCLVYAEEKTIAALSDSEWGALVAENLELCEDLRKSGHFVSASPLDSVRTAVTVRMRNGKLSAIDGPFAETKEQLGGYYLIEARDLDEAVQVAGRIPGARLGSVEVRRIPAHDPREPWSRRG
ncbi:MAG TPA: YciI family protein [Solirubrobacterales bacterium]|nr:YciI family protein [Solirubrobacterales bacterium]